MYESILVPVDGSAPSDAAAAHAVELARRFDAAVSAVTVVERGTPHEAITARVDDADLVSIGTHGRTGLQRLLLGSVTDRVLRTSEVPVLTTGPREDALDPDAVLVPTDGSSCAERAADHALAVADRFDATVHALSVVDVQTVASVYHGGSVTADLVDTITRDRETAVEAVADRVADRGLDAETAVEEGVPASAIDEYVADHGVDLVTMGTHGRSGVDRYLLGSVTEHAVRSSDVPVLTVPPTV